MTGSVINIEADLSIQAGAAAGHLGGSGSNLVFETANLTPFITSSGDRASLNAATDRLASAGISISLNEGGRTVANVGAVDRSLIAALVGFRHIRVRRPFLLLLRYLRH